MIGICLGKFANVSIEKHITAKICTLFLLWLMIAFQLLHIKLYLSVNY